MGASRLSSMLNLVDAVDFGPSRDADGRIWMAGLPTLVDTICRRWGLDLEQDEVRHGYSAIVLPVRRGRTRLALKLTWPPAGTVDETRALTTWNGQGMVLLVDSDPELGVLLLERLDPGRTLVDVDPLEAASIAGTLLRRLAIPVPPGFPDVRAVAAESAESFETRQSRLGRPVPGPWLSEATRLAHHLSIHAGNTHLIDSDLHYDNILAGTREAWLAVDPRAMAGEPEQAIPELMWTRISLEDSADDVLQLLATLVASAELDTERVREWLIVRCVDYWLWGLEQGLTEDPKRCRRILEIVT